MEEEIANLHAKLRHAWSPATSSKWTAANPACGQCSVTSLVVHDRLGGSIVKTRVGSAWHFYNVVHGERIDLTASQFPDPIRYDDQVSSRDEAFADTSLEQYNALTRAVSGLD